MKRRDRSVHATAEASLPHLGELGVAREAMVLQSQSLGSGVAVEMARYFAEATIR